MGTLDDMSLLPQASVDRRLLKAAKEYQSPNEMSESVMRQLTPAQCAVRVAELLESKTTLDEAQERRLLLISMAEHLEWLRSQRDNPKTWNVIARSYKTLSDQIERTNVNVADVSTKLAEAHAGTFVEAYMLGFNALLKVIAERDIIEIEPEEVKELAQVGVTEASRYLATQTQKSVAE